MLSVDTDPERVHTARLPQLPAGASVVSQRDKGKNEQRACEGFGFLTSGTSVMPVNLTG